MAISERELDKKNSPRTHYSDKGGHRLRGLFARTKKDLEEVFPELYGRGLVNDLQSTKAHG